jgi:hypothetical protein
MRSIAPLVSPNLLNPTLLPLLPTMLLPHALQLLIPRLEVIVAVALSLLQHTVLLHVPTHLDVHVATAHPVFLFTVVVLDLLAVLSVKVSIRIVLSQI